MFCGYLKFAYQGSLFTLLMDLSFQKKIFAKTIQSSTLQKFLIKFLQIPFFYV